MKKLLLSISAVLLGTPLYQAQNYGGKWADYFSFNNILQIREDAGGKLVCASENGLFFYDPNTRSLKKISKVEGLHQTGVSAFDYLAEKKLGLIGYKDGSIDVLQGDKAYYTYDIPIAKGEGISQKRQINHIFLQGDQAIISTDFGLSVFKTGKREFGDTTFFRNDLGSIKVNEAAIFQNQVFAATSQGIYTKTLGAIDFPVFSSWQKLLDGNFTHISTDGKRLVASTESQIYEWTNSNWSPIGVPVPQIRDLHVTQDKIIITQPNASMLWDAAGAELEKKSNELSLNTAILSSGKLWMGTKTQGLTGDFLSYYKPDGPYNNLGTKIKIFEDKIYISGGFKQDYNNPGNSGLGFYYFNGKQWIYPELFLKNTTDWNVLDAVPNPDNPAEIWFANHKFSPTKGLYKTVNLEVVKHWYGDGIGLFNRVTGVDFYKGDAYAVLFEAENRNIPVVYAHIPKGTEEIKEYPISNTQGTGRPVFYNDVMAISGGFYGGGGLVLVNLKNPPQKSILLKNNGLPANGTVNATFDKKGDLWIANRDGLRILRNADQVFSQNNPQAEPVIITQNGMGEELFRTTLIHDIAVDAGNNKWVSVANDGVYYLSADGEQTLLKFTTANSPLPTNNVLDMEVDEKTGKVYFVTERGTVSYKADVQEVKKEFGTLKIYPNPVVTRSFQGNVTIAGIAERTHIRITDTAGNLVHSGKSNTGQYQWDLTDGRGQKVASGVYFVLLSNEDGSDTKTAKIAIIN